jgi:hypothetical protein
MPRVETGTGFVPEIPRLRLEHDGRLSEQTFNRLQDGLRTVLAAINGLVSFGTGQARTRAGNLDAQWVEYTFVDAATTYNIPHDLGRRPVWFSAMPTVASAIISAVDPQTWTPASFAAQSSTADTKVLFLLV